MLLLIHCLLLLIFCVRMFFGSLFCGAGLQVCPFIVEEEDAGCRMSVFVLFLFLTVSLVCLQFVIAFFA